MHKYGDCIRSMHNVYINFGCSKLVFGSRMWQFIGEPIQFFTFKMKKPKLKYLGKSEKSVYANFT